MQQEEREICLYLRSMPGQFVSARDIARRAGGKWRYRENPQWAELVLVRLLEKKIIETDATHHYRLIIKEEKKKAKKWVSPQMKRLLENSGKDFTHIISDDQLPADFFDDPGKA
jgi:hypothetical protein